MELRAEELLSQAEHATGHSDWGGEEYFEPEFRALLNAMVYSLENESALTAQGHHGAELRLRAGLAARLRFINHRRQTPALTMTHIERPMFILGLPRSGSTFLQNLIAQDPAVHAPLTWEMMMPTPPPTADDRADDPRIALAEEILSEMGLLDEAVQDLHPFGARQPEEDHLMMETMLFGDFLPGSWRMPTFNKQRAKTNLLLGYRTHRMVLQNLHSARPGTRIVLKNPGHIFYLDKLLDTYPDALLVQTHRDPAKVIPSVAALLVAMRKGSSAETPPPDRIAAGNLQAFAAGVRQAMVLRQQPGIDQHFCDVHFREMISDPIDTVARIYERFGIELRDEARAAMKQWLDDPASRSPKGKHTLSAYRLDEAAIDGAFAGYLDHYGVELER